MSALPAERLVFLDESGVTTKMARTHARAPRGQRAYGSIPLGSWQRLTVLGALACDGLVATMSIEASTSTPVLLAYLDQVLVPKLRQGKPDAILVMDNLRPHRATEVGELHQGFSGPDIIPIGADVLLAERCDTDLELVWTGAHRRSGTPQQLR